MPRILDARMIYLCQAVDKPQRVIKSLTGAGHLGAGQSVKWLFLGRNYFHLMKWEEALGPTFERISYSEELQNLALEWRQPYLDWIARLGVENDSLAWWSSRIAERNTLLDSLYHSICYLKIALIFALKDTSPIVIVAEDAAVLGTISEHSALQGRTRHLRSWRTISAWVKFRLRLTLRWGHHFADGVKALWDARRTRQRKVTVPGSTDKIRVLLHTCIDDTYFGANGEAHDRYFPGLVVALRRQGCEVITVPWLSQLRRTRRQAFAWFRQHPRDYLLPEDFYSFADYIWAARVVFKQRGLPRGRQVFQGLDITQLVATARLRQLSDPNITQFVRYFRLVEKWAKLGLKTDVFIDVFENHLSEKPQVLAFRKWMPEVMTVGFQHYGALPPLWLNAFSSPEESAFAPHPDVIVCNSRFTARQLAEGGFPPAKLRVGPSLRYQHLATAALDRAPEKNTVLVILPMEMMAVKELTWKLLKAFPKNEGLSIWLKLHPMHSEENLNELVSSRHLPDHINIVEGRIEDFMAKVACVVAIATTAAFELALAAVPLVFVGRETDFDLNPLADFQEWDKPIHSWKELRSQVIKKLSLSPQEQENLQDWARHMRQEAFSPINEETVSAFVRPRRYQHQIFADYGVDHIEPLCSI